MVAVLRALYVRAGYIVVGFDVAFDWELLVTILEQVKRKNDASLGTPTLATNELGIGRYQPVRADCCDVFYHRRETIVVASSLSSY